MRCLLRYGRFVICLRWYFCIFGPCIAIGHHDFIASYYSTYVACRDCGQAFYYIYVAAIFRIPYQDCFLTGLYLTQVSEFGFVLSQQAVSSGAMTSTHGVILTAVTFVTIVGVSTPYSQRSSIILSGKYVVGQVSPNF